MNRKLILLSLLLFILQSCDPGYDAKIINISNQPIKVIFEYNEKIILQNIERKISFKPEVIYNNENRNTLFEIDPVNFIVTSIVQSKDTLNLEMGIGTHPEFKDVKTIKIFGNDTMNLENKAKMINAFTEKEMHQYQLIIQ